MKYLMLQHFGFSGKEYRLFLPESKIIIKQGKLELFYAEISRNSDNQVIYRSNHRTLDGLREKLSYFIGIEIRPEIEAYTFHNAFDYAHYPKNKDGKYQLTAFYNKATDTIRHLPSNICLIYYPDNNMPTIFWDGGNKKYRDLLEKQITDHKTFHHQIPGYTLEEEKGLLTYLISEAILRLHPDEQPQIRDSVYA